MTQTFKLDSTDFKILKILQEQGRITNAQLSKEIDLSPAPTLERVKKLESNGFILGYVASLNQQAIGLSVTTFVNVRLAKHNRENSDAFIKKINLIEEVIECHLLTGSYHFLLKVVAKDIPEYQQIVVEKISAIEEIDHMESMVVLSSPKDTNVLPVKVTFTNEHL